MKKIFALFLAMVAIFLFSVSDVNAYVSVKGYFRSNGTYVAPYVKSNPNGLKYDNYGWKPSQGLYNDTYGTRGSYWDTPTYVTDPSYYEGKSLYEQGKSSLSTSGNLFLNAVRPSRNVSYVTKLWVDNHPTTPCEQAIFLKSKEKSECVSYKSTKDNYTWNVTTDVYDGMNYRFDPTTESSYSCPDNYVFRYDAQTGEPLESCYPVSTNSQTLPMGCTSTYGFSVTSGQSCSDYTCASGMSWNGEMCV